MSDIRMFVDRLRPCFWLGTLALCVFMQSAVLAYTTPLGAPPDELAHLSYVRDVAVSGWIPDYAAGTIGSSSQLNYLSHPPLYYTVLGQLSDLLDVDPFADYRLLRLISAAFVGLGFLLCLLAARNVGVGFREISIATLATCAIPMFSYAAGSVNNDTLLYLGTGLFFYGASRALRHRRVDVRSVAWITSGCIITFLTKATASAFIVFAVAAYLLPDYRRLPSLLRNRNVLAIGAATAILCGAYYVFAALKFGAFMPKPRPLYPESPPQEPMAPIVYAWRYLSIMWDRLPVIMSHDSLRPMRAFGIPFFQGMLLIPIAGWLIARNGAAARGVPTPITRASNAVVLAALATMILHVAYIYRAYLHSGLLAGMQPRYFAFLLPTLWLLVFAMRPGPILRSMVTGAFLLCAIIAFWSSTPFVVAEQSAKRAAKLAAAGKSAAKRATGAGVLDEMTLSAGTLKLRGWAFDIRNGSPAVAVRVLRDDVLLASVPVDGKRPDVAKALRNPAALDSGFEASIEGIPDDAKPCELQVAGQARSGELHWLHRRSCP
jgi:hypothetical protein